MPRSPYNIVDYERGYLALHVRLCETPNASWLDYYYDAIYILSIDGSLIGGFYFRDLARHFTDYVMGFFKHWRFFRMYFAMVNYVFFTKDRYVMVFGSNAPLGLQTVECRGFGLIIKPAVDWLPQTKIPSAVIAYNFAAGNGLDVPFCGGTQPTNTNLENELGLNMTVSNSGCRSSKCDLAFIIEQDQCDKFIPIRCPEPSMITFFETLSYIPAYIRIMMGISPEGVKPPSDTQITQQAVDFAMFQLTGQTLSFGFYNPGAYCSASFIGNDSGILHTYVDIDEIDKDLDELFLKDLHGLFGGFGAAYIGSVRLRALMIQKLLYNQGISSLEVLWHFGPPIWLVMCYYFWGTVVYPYIGYDKTFLLLNASLVHKGEIESLLFPMSIKMFRSKGHMYLSSMDNNANYNLFKLVPRNVEDEPKLTDYLVRTFEFSRLYPSCRVLTYIDKPDMYLIDVSGKGFNQRTLYKLKNVVQEMDSYAMIPAPLPPYNDRLFYILDKGDYDKEPKLAYVSFDDEVKENPTEEFRIAEPSTVMHLVKELTVKGLITGMWTVHNGVILRMEDKATEKYVFVDLYTTEEELINFWTDDVQEIPRIDASDPFEALVPFPEVLTTEYWDGIIRVEGPKYIYDDKPRYLLKVLEVIKSESRL